MACVALVCASTEALPARPADLTELSLEQLLNVEVVAVSKFPQRAAETPAAVTVITADDLRTFGYRTLAEVLRGVRGFYFTNDRTYEYVGVRGFAPPGDYNDRVLVLVDGYRLNDNVYDQALFDSGFALDIELIERIEIARGPGASAYGSNALFGVVNVVTKRAAEIGGTVVGAEADSFGAGGLRAAAGLRFDHGAELVVSASGFRSSGPSLHFPEFEAAGFGDGRIHGADFDHNKRAFARYTEGPLSVMAGYVYRERGNAASNYGTTFDDARNRISDEQAFVDLKLETRLSQSSELTTRLFFGRHDYYGDYVYAVPPDIVSPDGGFGAWWGAEGRLLMRVSERQKVLAGIEYQNNRRQDQWWRYPDPAAPQQFFDSRYDSWRIGVFGQTDYQWNEAVLVNAGLRYDKMTDEDGRFSPRVGAVIRQSPEALWKFQYGSAFRAPNAYERFYEFQPQQIGNANLKPERIQTLEATHERYLTAGLRLTVAGYYYRIDDLIAQVDDGTGVLQFQNQPTTTGRGIEAEMEGLWSNGARARASYGYQVAETDAGAELDNSPRQMLKFNGSVPLPMLDLRAGMEMQAMSRRKTWNREAPGFALLNFTLLRPRAPDGLEVSASVFNLFDKQYADPAILDAGVAALGIVRDRIPQEGRSFRLRLSYRF